MGHIVSSHGHCPSPRLVEKIRDSARPKTRKELMRFLGLANFYREYVPRFADIAQPLYKLIHDSIEWLWDETTEGAFRTLITKLTDSRVILAFPNWGNGFVLQVDASTQAVGGILSQRDDEQRLRPIAFFSSGLTSARKNYSAGELECWALIASARKFRKYLQAAPNIRFLTDYNPLVWLRAQKDPRGKFARWIQELESLDYTIQHVKGTENLPADYLSRIHSEVDWDINDDSEYFERHVYSTIPKFDILTTLKHNQGQDVVVSSAIKQLELIGRITQGLFKRQTGMNFAAGLLCRGKKIIVPNKMKDEIIAHKLNEGHFGTDKTTRMIRNRFYWKRMDGDIDQFCRRCLICCRNKPKRQPNEKLVPLEIASKPRHTVIRC